MIFVLIKSDFQNTKINQQPTKMDENILKIKIHSFIKKVYLVSQNFPKHELYGLTSQLRKAAVSVMLNYLEGFARIKAKVSLNFYEISFGSIKECKYIIFLARELSYLSAEDYNILIKLADEISAILWKTSETSKNKID